MAIKSIGIDIREANGLGAGKGRYTEEIVRALIRQAPEIKFFLFTKTPNPRFENSDHVHQVLVSGRSLAWHLKLRRYLKHHPVDLFLAPTSYIYPALAPKNQKIATVVHDLIAFLHSKDHHWFPTLVEKLTLKPALRHSELIITVSHNTWKDLIQVNPESASKPHVVVTPAIGPELHAVSEARMELPDRFLLAVGTLQPRKNIQGVLKAFARVAASQPDLHLCIAGGDGWKTSTIFQAVPAELQNRIHFLGYVHEHELLELYSRTQMLIFPSFYEGFGMPPLEAMACGCPVIVSNVSSLPEVVGEAALQVDPHDEAALVEGITTLLDPAVQMIAKERGLSQAAQFSWDQSAQTLLRALQ